MAGSGRKHSSGFFSEALHLLQHPLVTWSVSVVIIVPGYLLLLTFLRLRGGKAGETTSLNFKQL